MIASEPLFFPLFSFLYKFILINTCLKGGVEGKRQVDKIIDKCASMQVVFPVLNLGAVFFSILALAGTLRIIKWVLVL